MKFMVAICGAVSAILLTGAIVMLISHPANANAKFAKETGKPCAECHETPTGGALTPYGEKFKANDFKLPAK